MEVARDRFATAAKRAMSPAGAGLLRALATGDRGGLEPKVTADFARSGLAHLYSVSGLHLAVVVGGVYRLIASLLVRVGPLARRRDTRRMAALAALPLAPLYALFTGAEPPVLRAALGAVVVLAGVAARREADGLNTLGLAGTVLLALSPGDAGDPGFQLSFAAVAGMVLWAPRLRAALPLARAARSAPRWRRWLEGLATGVCASVAATLATAPILAYHFRGLSLAAIPANLTALPLGALLTWWGALGAAAAFFGEGWAALLLAPADLPARALLALNRFWAAPGWATLGLASPGPAAAVGATALLLFAAWLPRRRSLTALALAACLVVLPGPVRAAAARRRAVLDVAFLAVGQGDATVLRLPDGAAFLVDGGGNRAGPDPGARVVVPFLRDAGVRQVAAAFVTHPHPDHLLGLPAVAEGVGMDALYSNGRGRSGKAWRALPPPHPLQAGDVVERAGVRLEVLAPPPLAEALGENDASLVLRVVFGDTAFLLAGDLEAAGERALLAGGRSIGAQVVKVPHHGSRTSSTPELVAAVGARWAVFSVGARNRFGFPHREVVARWTAAGAEVARTDQGSACFRSDGRGVTQVGCEEWLALGVRPRQPSLLSWEIPPWPSISASK
jgi:competence protein ComEC